MIAMSLVLAIGINIVINDTSIGQQLQVSVINSWENSKVWDIYLKLNNEYIEIISSKNLQNIKSFSATISYNPTNINIKNINSLNWWNVINQANEEWLNTIIINFPNTINLKNWDKIWNIVSEKMQQWVGTINIINANFTDSNNQVYMLSSSWIEY